MTKLVVEVDDLAGAARQMYADVASPVGIALENLNDALYSCAAMAGSDEAGTAWAASYDPAAAATVRALAAAENGCYRLAAMFAQTARNYAAADSDSTPAARHTIAADLVGLPTATSVSAPSPPSAVGGSGGGPPGWGLVEHAVGYVWPNGHQDKLQRAADAWSACASALDGHVWDATLVPITCFVDGLPEYDDMHTACSAMGQHLHDLARACRSLAAACRELAHHIDEVHSEVEHQLIELGAASAGIQVLGGILSAVTAGAAEAPTQELQYERITSVANSVRNLITKFIALAKDAIADLPAVKALTERIELIMERLQSSRLAIAGMDAVPNLPGAAKAAKVAETPEVGATERLVSEVGESRLSRTAARFRLKSQFTPPKVFHDRHGLLSNGRYQVLRDRMAAHVTGTLAGRKSQFLMGVDADKTVLDAAAYADKNGLWVKNTAKVYVENGPVGVIARNGQLTHWVNIYKTGKNGVHGCPGGPP